MANASTMYSPVRIEETMSSIAGTNYKAESYEFDDIIEKIGNLRIARNYEGLGRSEAKNPHDSKESEGADLVERGPIRPQLVYSDRDRPYNTLGWPARSLEESESVNAALDYETTAEQLLRDREYSEKLNPCLDQLENCANRTFTCSYSVSKWNCLEGNRDEGSLKGRTVGRDIAPLPEIIVDDPGEDSLLEILGRGGFQAAQVCVDGGRNSFPSPANKTWPDSPMSSYNVQVASRSGSRASSRAQSPGSGTNLGSPLMQPNLVCSPVGSPGQILPTAYRVPQALSSSSSSNQSYGDTPSPISYQAPLNLRLEDRLRENLDNCFVWNDGYESSGTVVNTCEIVDTVGKAGAPGTLASVDSIDSNELQLVEEVLRDLGGGKLEPEEAQVVPKSLSPSKLNADAAKQSEPDEEEDEEEPEEEDEEEEEDAEDDCNGSAGKFHQGRVPFEENLCLEQELRWYLGCDGPPRDNDRAIERKLYDMEISNALASLEYATQLPGTVGSPRELAVPRPDVFAYGQTEPVAKNIYPSGANRALDAKRNVLEDFQIPEMVASFESCRQTKRNSDRSIMPWPSLNLPSIKASERLKAGLNPKEVQRAMSSLLKKPMEELTRADEDGDTMLMCLVGNPEELARKKAYLAPLVERLGNVKGALSMMNNRGEDALYLAAINSPRISYVVGYLAAAMLQKGIDISQRLYHTRGDTLIHSVAARGDSHGEILAELLALRTVQGNAVFDLSKRNYDGRTALHVAVEAHDPSGRGVVSVATTRLLLKYGADPKIKETKCGDTALHMAVSLSCDPALVKVLLEKSTPDVVNATNYNQNTALHMAASVSNTVSFERQKEVCWLLVHADGLSNIQNRQGKTPLALVAPERKEAVKRIFYKKS